LKKNPDLQVIGLHTLFEHYAAMSPVAGSVHPRISLTCPIGVDEAAEGVSTRFTTSQHRRFADPLCARSGLRIDRCCEAAASPARGVRQVN
jgi:hypothetical protein